MKKKNKKASKPIKFKIHGEYSLPGEFGSVLYYTREEWEALTEKRLNKF